MANNVIGLFENEAVANRVVEELIAQGFDRGSIKRFQGNNAQIEDELRHEGIPADEASYYVNGLNEGGALVSVRAEESETDNAVEIMNRFVAPEEKSAQADTETTPDTNDSETSYQGSEAGWDEASSSDGEAAASTSDAAAYESDNQEEPASWSETSSASVTDLHPERESFQPAPSAGPGFPVGREAYAAYQRRVVPQETSYSSEISGESGTATPAAPGFPIGREAYEAYNRDKAATWSTKGEGSSEGWNETPSEDTDPAPSGFAVGREAYEAYSREKASRWGQND